MSDNLKKWQKGQSGNPNGRPRKKVCLTSHLRDQLSQKRVDWERRDEKTMTKPMAYWVAKATITLAIKGNATAINEIWDRIDGRMGDLMKVGLVGAIASTVTETNREIQIQDEPRRLREILFALKETGVLEAVLRDIGMIETQKVVH